MNPHVVNPHVDSRREFLDSSGVANHRDIVSGVVKAVGFLHPLVGTGLFHVLFCFIGAQAQSTSLCVQYAPVIQQAVRVMSNSAGRGALVVRSLNFFEGGFFLEVEVLR